MAVAPACWMLSRTRSSPSSWTSAGVSTTPSCRRPTPDLGAIGRGAVNRAPTGSSSGGARFIATSPRVSGVQRERASYVGAAQDGLGDRAAQAPAVGWLGGELPVLHHD